MKFFQLLSFILFATSGMAQITFDRTDLNASLDGIEGVHALDFDEDGDTDIFTASRNDNRVTLFLSNGNGNFTTDVLSSSMTGASNVKSYDMDGDKDLDIIVSGSKPGTHSIMWFENLGSTFADGDLIVNITDQSFQDFIVLDIDMDGDMDIVSVAFSIAAGPGVLALWRNTNFVFEFVQLSDNCIDGRNIEAIDWDMDGDLDFLISEGLGNKMTLWSNEGGLNYEKHTLFSYNVCNSFAIYDVDEDGDRDIFALSFTGDQVSLWRNGGNDNFTKIIIEDLYDGPDKLLLHDMDVDGDMDLLVAYYNEDVLALYMNNGNLDFERQLIDTDFDGGRDLYIADLDNDLAPDIVGASLSDKKAIIWISDLIISGNKDISLLPTRQLFPNPATQEIYFTKNVHEAISYQVYDMQGNLQKAGVSSQGSIQVNSFSSGVYVLRLIEDSGFRNYIIIVE